MLEKKYQGISQAGETDNGTTTNVTQKTWDLRMALEKFEKELIIEALKQNLGHRGKTAAMLGVDRKTLYMKLKKYEII